VALRADRIEVHEPVVRYGRLTHDVVALVSVRERFVQFAAEEVVGGADYSEPEREIRREWSLLSRCECQLERP
jgi:hypothetical protein